MAGGFITVALVMASSAYNPRTKITPIKEQNILQIKGLSDSDGKSGLDTITLENGRSFQIEEKENKLYLLEK